MKKGLIRSVILLTLLLNACQIGVTSGTNIERSDSFVPIANETTRNGPSDPQEIEAFFDGVMYSTMDRDQIAGVTIIVVKDGETLFSKGYGYADIEKRIAVDPQTTIFRIGSISKLFTWTAVMQLIEQGKLDLDEDIANYIDFEIPSDFSEPITMRHLLTHTAGFEDMSIGLSAETPETLLTIEEWLKTHIPSLVRPPGENIAYSNYGTTLAGYIVQRISGMDYDDYVELNIIEPLIMNNTSSRQPLPTNMDSTMSNGYQKTAAGNEAQPFELYNNSPAGGFSSTGADMAKFMIAHLQNGQYENAQILQETTAQQMHSQLYTPDERLISMAYGFIEKDRNGLRIIGHSGDTNLFHSDLNLLPDENIGIFISCNTASCVNLPGITFKAFLNHYYPVKYTYPAPTNDLDQRIDLITGQYRRNRISYTSLEKVNMLFSTFNIAINENDELLMQGARFVEIEPFVFQQVDGESKIVFHLAQDGTVDYFSVNSVPTAYERVTGLDSPTLNFSLLLISILFFFSAIIPGPILWLTRRNGCEKTTQPKWAIIARIIAVAFSLLCIFFIFFFYRSVIVPPHLYDGFQAINILNAIFVVIVILAIATMAMTIIAWIKGYWNIPKRLHYTGVMLSGCFMIWFILYWCMLKL